MLPLESPLSTDCVEERRGGCGIISHHVGWGQSMMGERQVQQDALFYEFSLERHVPERHLLRSIDRFVELDGLRRELAPFYSEMGRPSIDPELLIRMLIVGYCFGIRSERRLCEEVHLNLAYRWFCGLGLDGAVPDHSTFSKNRHGRFRDSDLLRRLFETVLQRCIDAGLVGGEGFAVDASLIAADAGDRTRVEGAAGLPPEAASRAVKEYLAVLDDAAFGAASEVTPKFIAPADPAARWTAAHRGPADHLDRRPVTPRNAAARHRSRSAPSSMPPPTAQKAGETDISKLDGTDICTLRLQDRAAHPGLRQIAAQRRHLLAR